MASHPGDTSRKPSGSSTRSAGHSPSASPNNGKFTPASATNMFGVGMGTGPGLKGLNSGWQVWGSSTPASKRNASISSAASVNDLSPQGENMYRSNLGESWTATRPSSGTWDELSGSPQKKEFSQLDGNPSLSLHHARQRQAAAVQAAKLSGSRIDDRSSAKPGQFSPQRFDNGLGKDASVSSRYPSPSNLTYGSSSFPGQNGTFDVTSMVEKELSLGLRGMAVEDDHINSQYRQPSIPSQPNGVSHHSVSPQVRPSPMVQGRTSYSGYPQADYSSYYPNGARDPYMDYGYGYSTSADPTLYPTGGMNNNSPANVYPGISPQALHTNGSAPQQSGIFYDFSPSARSLSQYYYPTHQPMMYPAIPSIPTPQVSAAVSTGVQDKKQYGLQQQAYAAAIEYSTQVPFMLPGSALYGHPGLNAHGIPFFHQNVRPGRRHDNDPTLSLRSPLLDEFRANKSRKWELRDILGYVVEFSGDQHGSRFIQQKLETATSEEKQIVFDEIVPNNTLQLIQDVFGNYVIQKLFEHGTQVQKTVLANTMEGHILPLSLQMYGCRVVQKAVEFILPEQQGSFVKELEPHVLKCVKDANGNHVIQKLIERVSADRLGFVQLFRGNVYDLSTHPYGCRVLQRCFEHLPEEQTRALMDELHRYMINLMQDQFGNYVVQFVLEQGKPHDRYQVIAKLRGQMLNMARHKFASNVCEKALVTATTEERRGLVEEIIAPKPDGVSPIVSMMKDQFANYVLQRALTVADQDQKDQLASKIRPQLVSMRRYSSAYSKHLISIERLLERTVNAPKASLDKPADYPSISQSDY
ncbi:armadillo-type protein [Chiua virens]|nr:armadillo-type protein [Chiua virens]